MSILEVATKQTKKYICLHLQIYLSPYLGAGKVMSLSSSLDLLPVSLLTPPPEHEQDFWLQNPLLSGLSSPLVRIPGAAERWVSLSLKVSGNSGSKWCHHMGQESPLSSYTVELNCPSAQALLIIPDN